MTPRAAILALAVAIAGSAAVAAATGAPLWLGRECRPNADAQAALALLAGAAEHGLEPARYGATELAGRAATLQRGGCANAAEELAAFEVDLSSAVLTYLQELHAGRVDPHAAGFRMTAPKDHHDYAASLRDAVARHAVAELAASLEPQLDQYRSLRATLARYRALALGPPLELPAPRRGERGARPGEPYPSLAALWRLLLALGDLPDDAPMPVDGSYSGTLVEAVRKFQSRHGLDTDGILGFQTLGAMAVPMSARVRQLELALERLRWLPHLSPDGFVVVNIPAFRLVAWGPLVPGAAERRAAPDLAMAVIVGRAFDRETPVFVDEIEEVIFRPYWNVPPSIVRGEILPALRRRPDYLSRHDMEIVRGAGDDARPVAVDAESLAGLRAGELRLRQRPGPANALGLVKLAFPNAANVYMHGTPAPELFARARRDFSHGCVRVEDPPALAEWALADEGGWDRQRVVAAMNGQRQLRVRLRRPRQVILFYVTAIVRAEDGAILFFPDVYGHDSRLENALADRKGARHDRPDT